MVTGMHGATITAGSRVRTQYTVEEGGDGEFYDGVVTALRTDLGTVSIMYDDGDTWTGGAEDVELLPKGPAGFRGAADGSASDILGIGHTSSSFSRKRVLLLAAVALVVVFGVVNLPSLFIAGKTGEIGLW